MCSMIPSKSAMISVVGFRQSLLGSQFRITRERGQPRETQWASWTMATYHPSAVLRSLNEPGGEQMQADFLADLRLVAEKLDELE